MRSRTTILVAAAALAVAGATAAAIVLAESGAGARPPPRAEYLARVEAICREAGRRLDGVPPPTDPASPGAIYESIGRALPILREQARRVRAVEAPPELRRQLERFFALTDRSLAALERARRESHDRALFPMVQALSAFEASRDDAKRIARAIGFKC